MKKILLIEDDPFIATAMGENLTHEGFEVVRAKDGEVGLSAALTQKPDLILLDIILPKIGGLELLGKLRKDSWGKDVPVIILSNLSEPLTVAEAIEYNVNEYLVKSDWKIEEVIKKVREKLKLE